MRRLFVSATIGAVIFSSMAWLPAARAAEPSVASSLVGAATAPSCSAQLKPSGSGTAADPYLLLSPNNLAWLNDQPDSWSATFEQRVDIDAAGCTWTHGIGTSTKPFTGTYLGDGDPSRT
jgi:hypothetical protein